jgi:hypothetical protein
MRARRGPAYHWSIAIAPGSRHGGAPILDQTATYSAGKAVAVILAAKVSLRIEDA